MDIADWCRERLGLTVVVKPPWSVVRHSFSHFQLDITPVPALVTGPISGVMEGERFVWYNPGHSNERGVAAPVKRLLAMLANEL